MLLKADGIYGRYLRDAPAQAQPGYLRLGDSVHRLQQQVEAVTFRPGAAGAGVYRGAG